MAEQGVVDYADNELAAEIIAVGAPLIQEIDAKAFTAVAGAAEPYALPKRDSKIIASLSTLSIDRLSDVNIQLAAENRLGNKITSLDRATVKLSVDGRDVTIIVRRGEVAEHVIAGNRWTLYTTNSRLSACVAIALYKGRDFASAMKLIVPMAKADGYAEVTMQEIAEKFTSPADALKYLECLLCTNPGHKFMFGIAKLRNAAIAVMYRKMCILREKIDASHADDKEKLQRELDILATDCGKVQFMHAGDKINISTWLDMLSGNSQRKNSQLVNDYLKIINHASGKPTKVQASVFVNQMLGAGLVFGRRTE